MTKAKVAILGTGKIGYDLLHKVLDAEFLECSLFSGKNQQSNGIAQAKSLGIPVSAGGIRAVAEACGNIDILFDATSAQSHMENAAVFLEMGITVIDLTPARAGRMCVPAINLDECLDARNINMVSCGGQAAIPLAYAIRKANQHISYVETISTIASRSAGPATRLNLDEYIDTTETGLCEFLRIDNAKAILNINPAEYGACMQTTVFAKVPELDIQRTRICVQEMVEKVRRYAPGYELILEPIDENNRLAAIIRTTAVSKTLPPYAGNLDIINCAAIAVAEAIAKRKFCMNTPDEYEYA